MGQGRQGKIWHQRGRQVRLCGVLVSANSRQAGQTWILTCGLLSSWGARFVCRQLSAQGICKAGAVAHPSFLKESDIFRVEGQ